MPVNISLSGGRLARRSLVNVRASAAALALAVASSAFPLGAAVIDFSGVPLKNSYAGPGGGSA